MPPPEVLDVEKCKKVSEYCRRCRRSRWPGDWHHLAWSQHQRNRAPRVPPLQHITAKEPEGWRGGNRDSHIHHHHGAFQTARARSSLLPSRLSLRTPAHRWRVPYLHRPALINSRPHKVRCSNNNTNNECDD